MRRKLTKKAVKKLGLSDLVNETFYFKEDNNGKMRIENRDGVLVKHISHREAFSL